MQTLLVHDRARCARCGNLLDRARRATRCCTCSRSSSQADDNQVPELLKYVIVNYRRPRLVRGRHRHHPLRGARASCSADVPTSIQGGDGRTATAARARRPDARPTPSRPDHGRPSRGRPDRPAGAGVRRRRRRRRTPATRSRTPRSSTRPAELADQLQDLRDEAEATAPPRTAQTTTTTATSRPPPPSRRPRPPTAQTVGDQASTRPDRRRRGRPGCRSETAGR